MSKYKKILSLFLAICLMSTLLPVIATQTKASDRISVVGSRDDGTWLFPLGMPIDETFSYIGSYLFTPQSRRTAKSYNIYTLGFFHSLTGSTREFAIQFMTDLQNSGYYEVTDPEDLKFTFGEAEELPVMPGNPITPTPTVPVPENTFVDVPDDSYYQDAVIWASEEGITAGTSNTTFSPDADCTRAQIVTFLYRTFG